MFRFDARSRVSIVFLVGLLVVGPIRAAAPSERAQTATKATSAGATTAVPARKPRKFNHLNFGTVYVSLVNWGEQVDLVQGSKVSHAHSTLLGNSLGMEWEHFFKERYGFALQGALMSGVIDVGGGRNAPLPYTLASQHWWGAEASPRLAYRFSTWIITSIGPIVLYRELTLGTDPSGTSAQSSTSLNYGATADLRMRLTEGLELREEVGSLAVNASTYWTLGLGYKF